MSLWELSDWCAEHLGSYRGAVDPRAVSVREQPPEDRPFDLPWVVLDAGLARASWGWQPKRSLPCILDEIAAHTREHPDWLKLVA